MSNSFTWVYNQARSLYQRFSGDKVEQTVRNVETHIDRYINLSASTYAQELLNLLKSGMGRQEWELEFRKRLKSVYIASYMAGRGGHAAMTQADWGRIGAMLAEQYRYLGHFADQLWAGELNVGPVSLRERQLLNRIGMYFKGAREAYNRALAASHLMPTLPQYPGDGKTQCGTSCQCHLEIDETDDDWRVTWALGAAEHCPDCIRLASDWNPLVIHKQAQAPKPQTLAQAIFGDPNAV